MKKSLQKEKLFFNVKKTKFFNGSFPIFIALNFYNGFRQYDDVKKLREEQEARGCSFYQMIDNFKNTLKHEDYTLTEDIITDIEWMENYIFTLGRSSETFLADK